MPPLPKPPDQRRRRNHGPQITYLPAEGRVGKPPKWPLEHLSPAESKLWTGLWKMPEAVVWEREMSFRLVARYVRILAASEDPGTGMKMMQVYLAELRQLEDRLLLSPKSKVQNRYAVRVPEEVTPIAGVPAAVVSPRDRLKAAAAAS